MEKLPGAWVHYRDMTPDEYQTKYNAFAAPGLRLYHLSVMGDRISAIWRKP